MKFIQILYQLDKLGLFSSIYLLFSSINISLNVFDLHYNSFHSIPFHSFAHILYDSIVYNEGIHQAGIFGFDTLKYLMMIGLRISLHIQELILHSKIYMYLYVSCVYVPMYLCTYVYKSNFVLVYLSIIFIIFRYFLSLYLVFIDFFFIEFLINFYSLFIGLIIA